MLSGRSCALIMLLILPALPVHAAPDNVAGTWLTEDGRARVRTEHCGERKTRLCGYVVWLEKSLDDSGNPKRDTSNLEPKKRNRAVLGHQLMLGLKLDEEGHYEGKIYNGDDGKLYDVAVWSEGGSVLQVKGCLMTFLCQTQTWKRVTDTAPGELSGPTNGSGGPRSDPEWAGILNTPFRRIVRAEARVTDIG